MTSNRHDSPFRSILSSLAFILPPLLAVLIFAPTISHPLMYDTLLHTQLADGQTLLSVFLPDERFGFYRPLVFLPIVFFQNLLDRYPVWLFHWLNVMTHALNALLLTKFVWRISGQRWQSVAAGLLLASFPFAYQALAIYGNNPYLTVTFFILLGLNLVAKQTNQSGKVQSANWKVAVIFLLGVLVHETAVLLIPLVILLVWLRSGFSFRQFVLTELSGRKALYIACIVYLIFYLFLPRGGGPTLNFGGNALLPKILLFLQTAAWPFVLALHKVLDGQVAIIGAFAVLLIWGAYRFWLGVQLNQNMLIGIGASWFLLASILIGVTLPTYYIEDGARLLYPGAVGITILWSALLFSHSKPKNPYKNFVTIFTVFILVVAGGWFNRRIISLYKMGSQPIHTIGEVLAKEQANDDLILINLPQWVAWPQQIFPAGTEFAPVMGSHLFAAELVRANYGVTPEITILDVPEVLPEPIAQTAYTFGVYRVGAVGEYQPRETQSVQIVATEYRTEEPVGLWKGTVFADEGDQPVEWSADSFDFLQQTACIQSGTSIIFESVIRPTQTLDEFSSLFVQALTSDGRLVAQNDGPPLGVSPQRLIVPKGMLITDRRVLTAEETADSVLSGVYNFMTGEREKAIGVSGELLPDNGSRINLQGNCP